MQLNPLLHGIAEGKTQTSDLFSFAIVVYTLSSSGLIKEIESENWIKEQFVVAVTRNLYWKKIIAF